ncbi:MAG TPA: TonB family protein [Gemmatimonadaceae bacterium]|nr:TonB family protein [Gemmatimonadaceae bacterium]
MFNVLIASGKTKQARPVAGAVASVVAHGAVVTALLLWSRPAIRVATDFEERIAEYLFPKNRAPVIGEHPLVFVGNQGGGTGTSSATGPAHNVPVKHDPFKLAVEQPDGGTSGTPPAIAQEQKMAESLGAFALLDVDSAAVRDPHSVAPVYPKDMEANGINGVVRARFVVDSTGRIDVTTVTILSATNESFARAVRTALPEMKFRPAMMGSKAVRQLSEEDFAFKVQPRADSAAVKRPR